MFVVPFWQGGKVYESIYFLLCDYWAAKLVSILNLIMSFKAYMMEKL